MSLDADQAVFLNYETGTITSGCGTNLDVLAVGYDSTAGYYLVKLLSSARVALMIPMLNSAQNCQAPELMLVGQAVALEALEALEALALLLRSTMG